MEEKLVEFDTALLAKGKGFNLCIKNFYNIAKKTLRERHKANWNNNPDCVSAPTQACLQKWIREYYNKHIYITNNHATDWKGNFYYVVDFNIIDSLDYNLEPKELYESYEDCLEAGLIQILKNS